jgi:hypothetical protein
VLNSSKRATGDVKSRNVVKHFIKDFFLSGLSKHC